MKYRVELAIIALCGVGIAIDAWAYPHAPVDRNPEGEKPQALSAKHESAVPKAGAQNKSGRA